MSDIQFYEVGGAVRDRMLGLQSKDIDFAVEAESFKHMEDQLKLRGFKIFLSTPEFLTIRAQVPPTESEKFRGIKTADFVLCRKDSPGSDGRRPDYVEPGTIYDDLARRDFTVNAMAMTAAGQILDPHGGKQDLEAGILRFVGDPMKRIAEDGLRVMRAFRFAVTKGFAIHWQTQDALRSELAVSMLGRVSVERIREELERMLAHDTIYTVQILANLSDGHRKAIFRDRLRLSATMKE